MSQGNDEKRPEDANPELPVFKPDKSGLEQALGTLEAQVMEAVWDGGGDVCVDDVVMQGRAYYYSAALSRRELGRSLTRRVINGLLGSFAEPAMSYFVEALGDEDPERLDTLAEMIEQQKRRKKGAGET